MSANLPVIHLHGGPSDGLRLVWYGSEYATVASDQVNITVGLEYDYVYLPRLTVTTKPVSYLQSPMYQPRPSFLRKWWQQLRQWLMTPISYPLDMRQYTVTMMK